MNAEKDYSREILEARAQIFIEFKSCKEDAQLIADVINVLANHSNDISISYAQDVLSDAIMVLPIIVGL